MTCDLCQSCEQPLPDHQILATDLETDILSAIHTLLLNSILARISGRPRLSALDHEGILATGLEFRQSLWKIAGALKDHEYQDDPADYPSDLDRALGAMLEAVMATILARLRQHRPKAQATRTGVELIEGSPGQVFGRRVLRDARIVRLDGVIKIYYRGEI